MYTMYVHVYVSMYTYIHRMYKWKQLMHVFLITTCDVKLLNYFSVVMVLTELVHLYAYTHN